MDLDMATKKKKKSMMGPEYYRRREAGTKPLKGKAAAKFRLDTQKAIASQKFREESSPARLKMIENYEKKKKEGKVPTKKERTDSIRAQHQKAVKRKKAAELKKKKESYKGKMGKVMR